MIQSQIVQFLRWKSRPSVVWFAVPNGENRDAATGARLKAQGVRPGVADLVFVLDRDVKFLEVKTDIGRQSESQKQFQSDVEALGFEYAIVRTLDEAMALLRQWGVT